MKKNAKSKRGDECQCMLSDHRAGDSGSYCVECGRKTMETETRECQDCKHSKKLIDGWICKYHLSSVCADMHATYDPKYGTCWKGQ